MAWLDSSLSDSLSHLVFECAPLAFSLRISLADVPTASSRQSASATVHELVSIVHTSAPAKILTLIEFSKSHSRTPLTYGRRSLSPQSGMAVLRFWFTDSSYFAGVFWSGLSSTILSAVMHSTHYIENISLAANLSFLYIFSRNWLDSFTTLFKAWQFAFSSPNCERKLVNFTEEHKSTPSWLHCSFASQTKAE